MFILSYLWILCYLNIKNNQNFIEYKVTKKFFCSYLNSLVELTNERINHIITRHPELTNNYEKYISETLINPDQVRNDLRFQDTLLISRYYPQFNKGRSVVIAIVTEINRNFIVTAYTARKITQGEIIWTKN